MSRIEVWGTGKPLAGFSEDAVLTAARKLFPTKKSQHIARFIAGKRFLITRVNDETGAQKLIDGLAKSGIEADTKGPPPPPPPGEAVETEIEEADDEEAPLLDEAEDEPAAAESSAPVKGKIGYGKFIAAGIVVVLGAMGAGLVVMQRQNVQAKEAAEAAIAEAKTKAALAAKRDAEAAARKKAEDAAADKATAAAREALRNEQREAAVTEMTAAFAAGNYPEVIALSERFDLMYGIDKRVTKLEQEATFNLKEGARRGNFAAILDAQIKGSTRYEALRRWALEVQERAKPVEK